MLTTPVPATEPANATMPGPAANTASPGIAARSTQPQPEHRPHATGRPQPNRVDIEAPAELVGVQPPRRQVLGQDGEFRGRVGDGGVLEVDDADPVAVPEVVGEVGIAVPEYR